MKILVTGGSGMVGRHLSDLTKTSKDEWIFISSKDCNLINQQKTIEFFKEISPDIVIHLAALVGGLFRNIREKVEFLRDNLRINENVLEASYLCGIKRGIFCSSSCVFPKNPSHYPMSLEDAQEGKPEETNFSYSLSKRCMMLQCDNYNSQYGTNYRYIIPVNLYGEYDNFSLTDSHVISGLIHKFHIAEDVVSVSGTGRCLRQFLYAKDFALIIKRIVEENKWNSSILCAGEEVSIFDLAKILQTFFPTKSFEFDVSKPEGVFRKTIKDNIKETFNDFEYTSLETGLRNTIEYFIKNSFDIRK